MRRRCCGPAWPRPLLLQGNAVQDHPIGFASHHVQKIANVGALLNIVGQVEMGIVEFIIVGLRRAGVTLMSKSTAMGPINSNRCAHRKENLLIFALGKNSSLFFSWLSALLIIEHGGRGVATLARSRFGEWGKALFSAALAKSAWCRVILPDLERRPCNLGDPARIVVQSRKAGLKANLAIQIVSLVPLLHLHNGVR